ncbi:GGDEF domain-containing response regulator [Dissulfurirhabdus thermomarina]|uniref:GGDEF domain-containing response regulator n=1 Tax=Dissulfurirhabdus thermomarina TaxID=1765737 RepID=UPI002852ED4D|nr:diguanylate cyclase [Dissulfurirhabdus thermomarina]
MNREPEKTKAPWAGDLEVPFLEPQHILVVDDDVTIVRLLGEFLSGLGYSHATAADGREALERHEEAPATIIVTDLVMPRMDGMELIREVRARGDDTDIIVMTGYGRDFRYTDVIRAGASDFINKPFNLDELEAKLDRIIRERNLRAQLRRLSIHDALTDLYNRRHFETRLEEEAQRAIRQSYPLYLLMVDVDRFKDYNDRLGHQAGDEVLRRLARVLEQSTRRHVDNAFRYGGDEFAVIVPQASLEQAAQIAERIRRTYLEEGLAPTTLSIGVARLQENGEQDVRERLRRLVRCADEAMYAAKHAGGDRVVVDANAAAAAGSPRRDPPPPGAPGPK